MNAQEFAAASTRAVRLTQAQLDKARSDGHRFYLADATKDVPVGTLLVCIADTFYFVGKEQ